MTDLYFQIRSNDFISKSNPNQSKPEKWPFKNPNPV